MKFNFRKSATQALLALGAEHDDGMYELKLYTRLGKLRISVCDTAVRTRFDDVPKVAPSGTHLNPYSGKWNFEFGDKPTQADLEHTISAIELLKEAT